MIRAATALPNAQVWRAYGLWSLLVGIAFVAVYPACNWLTSLRDDAYALYLPIELAIPFRPGFVWAYFSMYLLFWLPPFFLDAAALRRLGVRLVVATLLCGVAFLLLPTRLGFERVVPQGEPYRTMFGLMFSLDQPHNLVPSLHVVYSALVVSALCAVVRSPVCRALAWAWLVLICVSTLLVHQHHLADVAAGLLVAAGVVRWTAIGQGVGVSARDDDVAMGPTRPG